MPVTTIGRSLILNGELQGKDGLSVQGIVKGKIEIDNIITVEKARLLRPTLNQRMCRLQGRLKEILVHLGTCIIWKTALL